MNVAAGNVILCSIRNLFFRDVISPTVEARRCFHFCNIPDLSGRRWTEEAASDSLYKLYMDRRRCISRIACILSLSDALFRCVVVDSSVVMHSMV